MTVPTTTHLDSSGALAALRVLVMLPGSTVAVSVADLPADLNVTYVSGSLRLRRDYSPTGQSRIVHPDTQVFIGQDWIRVPTVARYIRALAAGVVLAPVELTAGPTGALSHVDGAHRMLAARLFGLPFTANLRVRA